MSDRDPREQREDERIGETIAAAGPRPPMSAERLESIREAARQSWRASLRDAATATSGDGSSSPDRASEGRVWRLALAAAVVGAALVAAWWVSRSGPSGARDAEVAAAVVERVAGDPRILGSADARVLAVGDEVPAGARIEVGARGFLALRVAEGSLRVSADSTLRVESGRQVALDRGSAYFDSGVGRADRAGAALTVRTEWGAVTDVGTQFEVRVSESAGGDGALRVRVREGEVAVDGPGLAERAEPGVELTVRAGGEVSRATVPTSGPTWAWIVDSAPPFDPEGRTLGALLDWIARETGWTLRFEDPALADLRAETLHGPVVERPDRGFQDQLTANGLVGEVESGELVLRRVGDG